MIDALLLIHGLMKIALFIGVMVLVATAPSLADAAGHGPQTAMQFAELGSDDEPSWPRRMLNDHGNDQWMEPDRFEPMVNIDGTMMLGDFDVNGQHVRRDRQPLRLVGQQRRVVDVRLIDTSGGSGLQQLVRLDAQRDRELLDVVDRNVPDLALDVGHEGPVQVGLEGQSFLRQLLGTAQRNHVCRQQGARTDPFLRLT